MTSNCFLLNPKGLVLRKICQQAKTDFKDTLLYGLTQGDNSCPCHIQPNL